MFFLRLNLIHMSDSVPAVCTSGVLDTFCSGTCRLIVVSVIIIIIIITIIIHIFV